MSQSKIFVIKVGTSTLTKGTKKISRRQMLNLVQQMAAIQEEGHRVVLVSSGAIAAGRELLTHLKTEPALPVKQMFAAVGQSRLMQHWAELFALYEISVGQVLLTRDDFSDRRRYLNIRNTMHTMLSHRIIPIINENDTVTTAEIRVGDNDNLSALTANLIAADLLILLTDQQGLYTADPRSHPKAKLIPVVAQIDGATRRLASGSSKSIGLGTGGMITKIEAAEMATQSGTPTVIASAELPQVLVKLAQGERPGTLFPAQTTHQESRKRWLISKKRQGSLQVDGGAELKLSKKGASLLPAGITKVAKEFERGDIVEVLSPKGTAIAVGVSNYSSAEIRQVAGLQSSKIAETLGYSYGEEVIHRDNMVLIKARNRDEV